MESTNKFYSFRQNNSGGGLDIDKDKGITTCVIIEAESADEANYIAESKGIYFDGCDDGYDCDCCGDRWSRVDERDGKGFPHCSGNKIGVGGIDYRFQEAPDGMEYCVHYKDGRLEWFAADGSPAA